MATRETSRPLGERGDFWFFEGNPDPKSLSIMDTAQQGMPALAAECYHTYYKELIQMLDLKFIRANPEKVKEGLAKGGKT